MVLGFNRHYSSKRTTRNTTGSRNSESPFTNNDEPTPRVVPHLTAEEEMAKLRASAALGAGTPGFMTKQQQHNPSSPNDSDRKAQPGFSESSSGDSPTGGSGSSSSASGGGGSGSGNGGSGSGSGKGRAADEAAGSSSPTRDEPSSSFDPSAAPAPSGGGSSSDKPLSPHHERPPSPTSGRSVGSHASHGSPPKITDHEQGAWQGFLNLFRFEKKRASVTGMPSSLFGDAASDPGDSVVDLGDPHDLPVPPLSVGQASDSLLKEGVLKSGSRSGRSHSVLSPRGSTPVEGGTGGETAEEQQMRAYLQLESKDEADFTSNARKSASFDSNTASAAAAASQQPVSALKGGRAASSSSGFSGAASADAAHVEMTGGAEASASNASAAERERRASGGMAAAAAPPPPPANAPEGEAVIFRDPHAIPRKDAQERVFGDRKKSVVTVQQLLTGSTGDDEDEAPATGEQAEAARRAWERKVEAFDKTIADWVALQKGIVVPKSYDGPRIQSPPTQDCVEKLMAAFTRPEPAHLHQRFLFDLLLQIMRQWECPPPGFAGQTAKSVIDLPEPPEGSRLLIVGDTHGQLADVLWVFAEYGMPSPTNVYLFNGDVADRGSHAVEIFCLLFTFMLIAPGSVFLSRGNHENMEINERAQHYGGGFAEEVRGKYDPDVFMLFTSLFELLPLAFVIAGKALVIHGGLWRHRGVTLSQLRNLSHRRQCPEAPQTYDDYIFFDLLWSDPHPEDGDGVHESSRGDGCILFGRDMTVEFLRRNSLQLIIRSHQLPSDGHGYEVLHDGRCITVFSASNYGGSCYNAGAILVWEAGEIDAHEFIAPNLEAQAKARNGDGYEALLKRFSSRGLEWEEEVGCAAEPPHVARLDGEIVRMIKERVCRHRHQLAAEFGKLDKSRLGRLSVEQWGKGMGAVLSLDLPWVKYQPWLAELTESGEVEIKAFLSRFEVRIREQYAGWQRTVLQMFYNSLLAADLQITELLGFFDRDGDGMVSLSECTKALSSLELGLSAQQVQQLVLILGFDAGGSGDASGGPGGPGSSSSSKPIVVSQAGEEPCIDLEAYLKRLALVADHTVIARSEQELLDLQQIARWIEGVAARSGKSLSSLFMSWDDNSDGYIDYEEFVTCCFTCQEQLYLQDPTSLEYIYTREEFDELARTVDQAKTGRINYLSFLGLFSAAESAGAVLAQARSGSSGAGLSPLLARYNTSVASVFIEQICATIWSNDVILSKALRSYDPKGMGAVQPSHFAKALGTMNEALAHPFTPLTSTQIEKLVASLPLDMEGRINYKEFMASFEVRDKYQEA